MVRTYSFNPSTQCFADHMPCLKNSTTSNSAIYSSANAAYNSISNASRNFDFGNRTPHLESRKNSLETINNSSNKKPLSAQHVQMSDSYGQCTSTKGSSGSVMIMDDVTTLIGIRSVRIDGQKFYQPIDVSSRRGTIVDDGEIPIMLYHQNISDYSIPNNNNQLSISDNSQKIIMLEEANKTSKKQLRLLNSSSWNNITKQEQIPQKINNEEVSFLKDLINLNLFNQFNKFIY